MWFQNNWLQIVSWLYSVKLWYVIIFFIVCKQNLVTRTKMHSTCGYEGTSHCAIYCHDYSCDCLSWCILAVVVTRPCLVYMCMIILVWWIFNQVKQDQEIFFCVTAISIRSEGINSLRPEHNGRLNFQVHFLDGNECILTQMSLKFVPKGPVDSKSSLI